MTTERPKVSATARLTVAQAAIALGVSPQTLRRRLAIGEIKIIPYANNKDHRTIFSGATIIKYWETH